MLKICLEWPHLTKHCNNAFSWPVTQGHMGAKSQIQLFHLCVDGMFPKSSHKYCKLGSVQGSTKTLYAVLEQKIIYNFIKCSLAYPVEE